jgi:ArsR family transcriptional regulator
MNQARLRRAKDRATVFKAMGHPSRMLILEALAEGPKNVGELTELIGSDISTVSKHLSVLRGAGVVNDEARGRAVYYSLYCDCIPSFMRCVDDLIHYKACRLHESSAGPTEFSVPSV